MKKYLESTEYIDWEHPEVLAQAKSLAEGAAQPVEIAKNCFEFVRDEIKHSSDYQINPVTCRASDVLKHGTGYCYAKSHLLAALLRVNNIPAGLCYQRLTLSDIPTFCLHGLNAVYLPNIGWYRIDPHGNMEGVDTQFTPPFEKLAYKPNIDGEADLPEVWPDPLPQIIKALRTYHTCDELLKNFPDIEIVSESE